MKFHQIVIDTIIWLVKKHPGIDFTTINEKCGETLQGVVTQKEFCRMGRPTDATKLWQFRCTPTPLTYTYYLHLLSPPTLYNR